MNSPEHQKYLDELAEWFSKKFTKKELCIRIAEAISVQDSCGECEALTMRGILSTGEVSLITCAKCTDEIAVFSGERNEEE